MCIKFYVTAELFTSIDPLAYYLLLLLLLLLHVNTCQPVPIRLLRERTPGISGTGYLLVGCLSRHPNVSVKTLRETQSNNPNQWPVLISFSSTMGLLVERAPLPLRRRSNIKCSHAVVRECCHVRTTTKVLGEWQNLTPPAIPKPLKRSSPKFE